MEIKKKKPIFCTNFGGNSGHIFEPFSRNRRKNMKLGDFGK